MRCPDVSKQQYEAGFSALAKAEKSKKADKDADKVRCSAACAHPDWH